MVGFASWFVKQRFQGTGCRTVFCAHPVPPFVGKAKALGSSLRALSGHIPIVRVPHSRAPIPEEAMLCLPNSWRVQQGLSEAARCASTKGGTSVASVPPFS